jgi:hypothetical protein
MVPRDKYHYATREFWRTQCFLILINLRSSLRWKR